jgi:hypothetical protein
MAKITKEEKIFNKKNEQKTEEIRKRSLNRFRKIFEQERWIV